MREVIPAFFIDDFLDFHSESLHILLNDPAAFLCGKCFEVRMIAQDIGCDDLFGFACPAVIVDHDMPKALRCHVIRDIAGDGRIIPYHARMNQIFVVNDF